MACICGSLRSPMQGRRKQFESGDPSAEIGSAGALLPCGGGGADPLEIRPT